MIDKKEWYVYRHIRKDKNIPFYIGIGKSANFKRAYEKQKCDRNVIWFKITNKTEYDVEILFANLSKEEAVNKEKEFIKLYGRIDLENGCLSNMTAGGDGTFERVISNEFRENQRNRMLGDKNPMYGKKQSKETINKRINSLTGKKRSQEICLKKSIYSKDSIPIIVKNYKDGSIIGFFSGLAEACRILGGNNSKASMVLRGKRNHHKGYIFESI